jgi:hypothetical protein
MIYIKLATLLFVQIGGMILSVLLLFACLSHIPNSLLFFPIPILTMAGTMYLLFKIGPDLLDQI